MKNLKFRFPFVSRKKYEIEVEERRSVSKFLLNKIAYIVELEGRLQRTNLALEAASNALDEVVKKLNELKGKKDVKKVKPKGRSSSK